MEDKQNLLNSFERVKGYMTEDNQEIGKPEPTPKEVWERLKATADLRLEEAVVEDAGECHERYWQRRLKLINEELEAIHINGQAEQNRAISMYENGMKHY